MTNNRTYNILIGGGGTGGHVFPAISIANALREKLPGAVFLFVGAEGRMEMEKVPEAGYEIVGLPVAGFQRRLTWKNATFFSKLMRSMRRARSIIRKFKPDVAIGVGGYASGPIIRAAARKKVPVILQEQNSYAGVTNRLLAKSAKKICVAFEGMEMYFPREKIMLTGNPIRQDLMLEGDEREQSLKYFGLSHGKKVILIIGGSQGAGSINKAVIRNIDRLAESGIQMLWQCGPYYHADALKALEQRGAKNIILTPFIKQMNRAFQVADLIISRAGAGTISELCVVGKPVILVPSPNVAEDHQTRNAMSLVNKKAAWIVADRDADSKLVETMMELIKNEEQAKLLSENISKMAIHDSADQIAREVIKVLEGK